MQGREVDLDNFSFHFNAEDAGSASVPPGCSTPVLYSVSSVQEIRPPTDVSSADLIMWVF